MFQIQENNVCFLFFKVNKRTITSVHSPPLHQHVSAYIVNESMTTWNWTQCQQTVVNDYADIRFSRNYLYGAQVDFVKGSKVLWHCPCKTLTAYLKRKKHTLPTV